jgi:drug/metabolite transporter (DMT)-like permease
VLVALVGVLAVSPDGLFVRIMATAAPLPVVMFWKTAAVAIFALVLALGANVLCRLRLSWPVVAASVFQAFTALGFAAGITWTSPARASLLIACAPLWAAVFSVAVGDPLSRRTCAALALNMVALGLMFGGAPHILPMPQGLMGGGSILGDLVAAGAGVSSAGYLTAVRLASKRHPDTPLAAVNVLGFALAAALSLVAVLWDTVFDGSRALALVRALPPDGSMPTELRPLLPSWFWLAAAVDGAVVVTYYSCLTFACR